MERCTRADGAKRIHYRSISGPKPLRTLAMLWHKQRYLSPLVKGLIQISRRTAA